MNDKPSYIDKTLGCPIIDPFQQILNKLEELSIQIAGLNENIYREFQELREEMHGEKHS